MAQEVTIDRGPEVPVRIQLDAMPTGALVTVLMRDVMRVPYVISPDVLTDRDPLSVNLTMKRGEIASDVLAFLRGVGLQVQLDGGTVYVSRRGFGGAGGLGGGAVSLLPGQVGGSVVPSGNPLMPGQIDQGTFRPGQSRVTPGFADGIEVSEVDVPSFHAVVTPAHREPSEFVDVLQTVFPALSVAKGGEQGRDATILASPAMDRLVFSGPENDVLRAVDVVRALDKPRASVSISAIIVEVADTKSRGSALAVFADLLGGTIGLSSFDGTVAGPQSVSVVLGGLSALLSAVKDDSRFSIVAEPRISVVSGSTATLNAGSDVPTLGAIQILEGGQSVRSVEYRQSGITLTVRPVVVGGNIQLSVSQERSSFSLTNTGVNDSPTLNQTSVTSQLQLVDGQTVAIAGLDEKSETSSKKGLFGGLLGARSKVASESQLLLFIQADLIAPLDALPLDVVVIGPEGSPEQDMATQPVTLGGLVNENRTLLRPHFRLLAAQSRILFHNPTKVTL